MSDAPLDRKNLIAWYRSQVEEAHAKLLALRAELQTTNDSKEAGRLSQELDAWEERFRDSLDEMTRLSNKP